MFNYVHVYKSSQGGYFVSVKDDLHLICPLLDTLFIPPKYVGKYMDNSACITADYLCERIVKKQIYKPLLVPPSPHSIQSWKYISCEAPQNIHMHHQHKGDD